MGKKNKRKDPMTRSDIPYAERLRMNKLSTLAAHRDDAHLVELKLSLVSLNESEGLGCVRLSRFARIQQKNREEYYSDPDYMGAKLDEAVRKLGFIVEDGRLCCYINEDGKVAPYDKKAEAIVSSEELPVMEKPLRD